MRDIDSWLLELNGADRARIQSVLDAFSDGVNAMPGDEREWLRLNPDKTFRFIGHTDELHVLVRLDYDSSFKYPTGKRNEAIVWANVIVSNTSFQWRMTPDAELVLWRSEYPSMLVCPAARYIEAEGAIVGRLDPISLMTQRFVFDCLWSDDLRKDIEPIVRVFADDFDVELLKEASILFGRHFRGEG
jgi:hypothetical protein